MSRIVGIDLGTTHSLVATVDSGIPMVIADPEGHRLTPSVVYYPSHGGEPIVGRAARRTRVLHPGETVYSVKRFMGRRADEVASGERELPYRLSGAGNEPIHIDLPSGPRAPEEVSAAILTKLRSDAEASLGEPVTRAVITVPAYFNDAQRTATKRAGERAGLTVERILNEPTAAALAYGLNRLKERSKIAVFDFGGGTFDLSILELQEGVFQVLSTHGNTRLGGDDLDQRLLQFMAGEIRKAGGPDVTRDASLSSRVREACEQGKIRLSTDEQIEISLPFLTPDFSFSRRLSRAELEALTRDIIERARSHCLRSLSDARLDPEKLDQVLLVGGQTRMPLVRQFAATLFRCAEFEEVRGGLRLGDRPHPARGPALNTSQNPDEAVALGAAIQAEILSGGFNHMLLLDVTPLSLGIETFGGLMNVIIPRNSTIPVKAGEAFTNAVDDQSEMLIHVLQGERERAADNWSLGRFTLEFEPARRGLARVGVQFEIDANGILHVLARDLRTGREQTVNLQSAVAVDDHAVQRMVEESVEHAWEDLRLRQWVELKQRAEETCAATRQGLAQHGTELEPSQTATIQAALDDVDQALRTESPESGTGNLRQLKESLARLDDTTQALADLMMDRAMEGLLAKRGLLR